MYAVIKTGGKQYRVTPGEKLKVEQITADVGARGRPRPGADGRRRRKRACRPADARRRDGQGDGGRATAAATRSTIFKMRRRKHYQKHQGHRQNYTELKIDSIVG